MKRGRKPAAVGAGALVGAVLVGILWLGLDTWAEVLAGLL